MSRSSADGACARQVQVSWSGKRGRRLHCRAKAALGRSTCRCVRADIGWAVNRDRTGTQEAVYRKGAATPVCTTPTCAPDPAGGVQFRIGTDLPVRDEFLVLTYGGTTHTTFDRDRPGWRVREVPAPRVRRVLSVTSGATGAYVNGQAVEHYEGASASGGRTGSLAWASIPCEAGGAGDAQLGAVPSAPGGPHALDCDDAVTTAAVASRSVRWAVTGSVVGVADDTPATRLLVLDLPA